MRALKDFLAAVLLTAAILAGGFLYLNNKVSQGLDDLLRRHVFTDPAKASFKRAGIQAWRGRLFVHGLTLSSSGEQGTWKGTVDEVSLSIPVRRMFSGSIVISQVRVGRPAFEFSPSGAAPSEVAVSSPSERPLALGNIPGHILVALFKKFPVQEVSIEDGSLRLASASGGSPLAWEKVRIGAKRSGAGPDSVALRAEGRMSGQKSSFSLEAKLADLYSPCSDTGGQVLLEQLPVPALAGYFPRDPEMKFLEGQLSLNTQFTCKKDWLTASHLVEIKNFSVDVSENKKKILGVSVKYLKDLFRIEQLSFVVPMNGALADPHIGISSSLQQILLKMLEGKFEDKDKAEALAKRGGDYFGKKLDKALKDWLKEKRK